MDILPGEDEVTDPNAPVVTPDDTVHGKIGEPMPVNPEPDAPVDGDLEVEVVDARPPADRRAPIKDQKTVGTDKEIDKELEDLNTQGAKRIQELKHQIHDQRRLKEAAEREREAAVRYAAAIRERYTEVQKRASEIEKIAYEQALAKARAELEAAKRDHKAAYELGDADKVADATTRMAKAATEEQRFGTYHPREPEPPPEFRPDPRAVIPDQRALDWARRNSWFKMEQGADGRPVPANAESATAYSIHVALISEGIDPAAQDGKYYQELDRRLRAVYPERFQEVEEQTPRTNGAAPRPSAAARPVVAPANRSGPGPKKVTLTQDQVAIAKRLGVTVEDYARHVLMLEGNN